jgi:hypothetical protein
MCDVAWYDSTNIIEDLQQRSGMLAWPTPTKTLQLELIGIP